MVCSFKASKIAVQVGAGKGDIENVVPRHHPDWHTEKESNQ